jgi:hypothetical protein
MKTRREEIEEASAFYSKKVYVGSVDKNLGYQDFCSGAEWADSNPNPDREAAIQLLLEACKEQANTEKYFQEHGKVPGAYSTKATRALDVWKKVNK